MHLLRPFRPAFFFLAAAVASPVFAAPILYYTPTSLSNGLGRPSSNPFTQAVTNAFGAGNVVEIPTFENTADFADGSALFVNARLGLDSLSSLEQDNVLDFVNAGGAVFFIGDHASWTTWDNSFLNLFGDSYISWGGIGAASNTNAAPDTFSTSEKILLTAPGGITGGNGTPLFTHNGNASGRTMAAMYGPLNNAIAFLDTNAFGGNTNPELYADISSWLYTTASAYADSQVNPGNPGGNPVPEAGSVVWLLVPVMLSLAAVSRRAVTA